MYWPQPTIPIEDYTPAAWQPAILAMIADFNAALAGIGPTLQYQRMEGTCPEWDKNEGRISICVGNISPNAGESSPQIDQHHPDRLIGGQIRIDDDVIPEGRVLCHEMMHSIAGIADDYGERDDSCVWGWVLSHLGPWDLTYLKDAYYNFNAETKRRRKRRRRH